MKIYKNNFSVFNYQFCVAIIFAVVALGLGRFVLAQQIPSAESIISKHTIKYAQPPKRIPANHSVDAPLLGNGYVGIAVSGAPEKQVFYAARNDFWRLKSLHRHGYPAVLGMIELNLPQLKDASYFLEQKLFDATTTAKFQKGNQTVIYNAYLAATDDLFVVELKMEGDGTLEGNVRLVAPPSVPGFADKTEISTTKNIYVLSRKFTESVDIPTQAAIGLRIDGDKNKENNNADGKFILSAERPMRFICTFSGNFKSKNCVETVVQKASEYNDSRLREIETTHKNWWRDYWEKSYVSIPDVPVEIERQYYVSLYGMGSCSRDKDFPPPIFGTWNTKEVPNWSGDYHLNYNHNAPFYSLYSANRIEQADPYYAPLLAFMDRGHYYSEKVTNIPGGLLLPVGIGPLGIETTRATAELTDGTHASWRKGGNIEDEGMFWGQKSNSAYAVVNLSMQFYHTYDKEFTKKVYPFVRDVAYFWEKYLKFEDGRYVIYNDAVHEGSIGSFNPILSLGLVRMVMETARDMSILLDIDADKREKWTHIQTHLAQFPTQERNGKTVFRLTEKGLAWVNGNTLGIQHIYPAGQIGLDSDAKLLEISRNTIEAKQSWLDFNGSNSFFPTAVRIGIDAETILQQLARYSQHTYPNGFQKDNPHGIENWSTVPNTVNEMLCMGRQNIVRLFPVWSRNKNALFHQIRLEGAFLISAELKNGEVVYLSIFSEQGRTLNLLNPWQDKKIKVKDSDNNEQIYDGEQIQINTKSKTIYQLQVVK
ncbi:MAG: hypothetical protein LBT05_09220 [Planctomycetaceae bacterium]|jgi:predicted transposase YbfD/YdcC|nr:hypothetical protein [Planctomycetaceae bacterium]